MSSENKEQDFKIEKRVLRYDIKKFIEDSIISGRIKRGEKIIETKIAKQLGVSQSPVREAIRELEIMGLVETQPYKGTFVKNLTPKDILDIFAVRASLEGLAVKEAIKFITEDDIQFLKGLIEKMDYDIKHDDSKEYVKHDILFHEKITQISNNDMLIKVAKITNISGWTGVTANYLDNDTYKIANQHEPILKCLIDGDSDCAETTMKNHIYNAYQKVLAQMELINQSDG